MKKNLYCPIFHEKYKCYPEVWKECFKTWHCSKCYPCGQKLNNGNTKDK